MLPETENNIGEEMQAAVLPSLTYRLELKVMRIRGKVDKLEAVKQAVYKIIRTERYRYPVYSGNYGIEWDDLIGKDYDYVKTEAGRRLREALLIDDRIIEVQDVNISKTDNDSVQIIFAVRSTEGEFMAEGELNV